MTVEGPKSPQEAQVALKFPRRRIRNTETHNIQDMNDALLPVVEEMGRLNEHNFSDDMQAELAITDMTTDVAFNVHSSSYVVDVSDKGSVPAIDTAWAANTLFRIPQSNRWTVAWPDKLTKTFTSTDGGMFRILAGAQWGSESIPAGPPTGPGLSGTYVSSYLRYGLQIDGALIPDSVIGDQDYADSHAKMERGQCGQIGSFLLDFIIYLHPGVHTVEVVVQNLFLKDEERRSSDGASPSDAYLGTAEIFIWEMHR